MQVQVFPAFEGLSTFRARERMAGVEQSVEYTNTHIHVGALTISCYY